MHRAFLSPKHFQSQRPTESRRGARLTEPLMVLFKVNNGSDERALSSFGRCTMPKRRWDARIKVDLLVLGGDLVNFPSQDSVDDLYPELARLAASPLESMSEVTRCCAWMGSGARTRASSWPAKFAALFVGHLAVSPGEGLALRHSFGLFCDGSDCGFDWQPRNGSVHVPSRAGNVAGAEALELLQVPFVYTAGNHDWHLERLEEWEAAFDSQRARNEGAALQKLYSASGKGLEKDFADPLFGWVRLPSGLRVVCIDNSNFQIDEAQLRSFELFSKQSDPFVLVLHIPIFFPASPGWGINDLMAHPAWGAQSDQNSDLEQRKPWPQK
ncbi:unnamed protein product, partial [Effrenium voratum]